MKNENKIDNGAIEAARHGIRRSPKWEKVEKNHLLKEPLCMCCQQGAPNTGVQIHHIIPFHICVLLGRPDLELDERNLITLCESEKGKPCNDHHLLIGHLDDFKSSNLSVQNDCRFFASQSKDSIESNTQWLFEKVHKLVPLDLMTEDEKTSLMFLMDAQFPNLC